MVIINLFDRERELLTKIQSSQWLPVNDAPLELLINDRAAQLKNVLDRREYTPLEIVKLFLGPWFDSQLIDLVNMNLRGKQKPRSKKQRKYYKPLKQGEFLRFILCRMVHSLIKHEMHSIKPRQLEILHGKLMGKDRHKAISSSMTLEPAQIAKFFADVPKQISKWIALGTVYCIDESIFPFFGRAAFDKGLLQLIPNKPHDYGLVTYYAAQRLLWTNLPITIDLEPTWIDNRLTPLNIAITLLERNRIPGQHQHLIADNLWSAPSYFTAYEQMDIYYTLSVKPSAGDGLKDLIDVASTGLPTRYSRTFTRNDQVLQVVQVEDHITTIISNAWRISKPPVKQRNPIGSFRTALELFKNEPVSALCKMFGLDQSWLLQPAEKVIFEALGWDVLRPEDSQGETTPLDLEFCKKLKKPQLLAIYKQQTKHKRVAQSITKAQMLQALFGDAFEQEPVQLKATKRKREVAELTALRAEVCGLATNNRSVYDNWNHDWNDVDRQNKDYHSFYYSAGHRTEMKQGLESEIFMMMMISRAIYEEHLSARAYAVSGNKKSAVPLARRYTIPEFIFEVANALVAE